MLSGWIRRETSFLDLKSFAEGKEARYENTSWTGTLATSAKEVTLKEMVIGNTKFVSLKLPDCRPVGDWEGPARRKMTKSLGVDFLDRLGATINLKKQTVHVTTLNEERGARPRGGVHKRKAAMPGGFHYFRRASFR